jgi:manganese efflux pump family protein
VAPVEILLVAVALSIDAFAVSVAAAASGYAGSFRPGFRLAFHFGLFQGLMPVLGWAAGRTLEPVIAPFDHWVAFGLLTIVSVRMLRSVRDGEAAANGTDPTRGFTLVMLAIATSIDALAVGLTLAMLNVPVVAPALTIGVITALVSAAGVRLGNRAQMRFGRYAEVAGAIILLVVAVRIVLDHTVLAGG